MNGVNCAIISATEKMWCIHICTKKREGTLKPILWKLAY